MKIVCDRAELTEALRMATLAIPQRTPRPILQSAKIVAGPQGAEVLATDIEVAMRARIGKCDTEAAGEAMIPAGKALDIVRSFESEKVSISCEDRITTFSGDGSRFKVCGEDPADFPTVPAFDAAGSIAFVAGELRTMIDRTAFSAGDEGSRYALNGVLFDLKDGRLRLVATDGKRLAATEKAVTTTHEAVASVVPSKGMRMLSRLDDGASAVSVRFAAGRMSAASGAASISALLVTGSFPPYEGVIPKDHPHKIEIQAAAFLAALKRASILTSKTSNAIRMDLAANQLRLSSRSPSEGEAEIVVPIVWAGDPVRVSLDIRFLTDIASAISGERLAMHLKGPGDPALFIEGGASWVVMPISEA